MIDLRKKNFYKKKTLIDQDKPFIEISDECREIVEIIEPQKLDRIEIPTNYILSLEDNIHEEDYI